MVYMQNVPEQQKHSWTVEYQETSVFMQYNPPLKKKKKNQTNYKFPSFFAFFIGF